MQRMILMNGKQHLFFVAFAGVSFAVNFSELPQNKLALFLLSVTFFTFLSFFVTITEITVFFFPQETITFALPAFFALHFPFLFTETIEDFVERTVTFFAFFFGVTFTFN